MQRGLFIVGYWNSGTTLITDLLRKHPRLSLRRAWWQPHLEERKTKHLFRKFGTRYRHFAKPTSNEEGLAKGLYEPALSDEQKEWWRKKFWRSFFTLPQNILLLKNPWMFFVYNFLHSTFAPDDVRYLIVLRDGHMQACSWFSFDPENPEGPERLYARALSWHRGMEYFFNHWYNDPRTLTLRYENFCADPKREWRKVCAFAELDPEPLLDKLPQGFENRTGKWDILPADYKEGLRKLVAPMQEKIDQCVPIE